MKGSRILIVEDEGIVAMELASRIEAMGYSVAGIADTGDAAIAIAARSRVDLALVDVRLKGDTSGTDAAMHMRAAYDLPIVFLTAYSDDETLERIKRCEPRGYLLKPFDERTLWVTVETALYAHDMAKARIAAERAQRRSEAQRTAILEHSPDAIISIDGEQRVIAWNQGAEQMFGYAAAEVLGQPVDRLIPEAGRPRHHADVAAFAQSHRAARRMGENREIYGVRKSGAQFPADISISRLEIEGEVVLTAFVRDISERRAMEQELEQTPRLEALGRLAGGVAHDFNNLLVGVFGYARLLKQSFDEGDRRVQDVQEIERAAERASRLVRELLSYGRQELLRPERTDPSALLLRLESLLSVMLGRKTRLDIRLGDDVPAIVVDPLKFEQVVINLVLNARDAMPEGGTVVIETRSARPSDAPVYATQRCAVVSVSDGGVGMDEATLAHVFEPFFTTKSARGGTGMGLATVHGIVKQSGGEIRVRSAPGMGTCFDIFFPAAPFEIARPPLPTSTTSATTPRPRGCEERPCVVLLVDDEPLVRDLGARVLRDGGYTVMVAGDGREALEIVKHDQSPVDLLLTDVVMPHVNGYELADMAMDLRPALRVAVMSGYSPETRRRLGNAKDTRYRLIEKPFAPERLLRHVDELLAGCSCHPPHAAVVDVAS